MPETVPMTLPAMGESVSEGTVARWLKSVGDTVAEGEPLVEVTTDKVDVEVPSPSGGHLAEIMAQEGDTIAVGATLGTIGVGAGHGNGTGNRATPPPTAATAAPVAAPPVAPAQVQTTEPTVPVSPLARRAAALAGVDLGSVTGTGPGGAIRTGDVFHQPPTRSSAPRAPEGASTTPLRGPAAALVDYMEQSRDIPTATSFRTFPVTILDTRRRQINAALAAAGRSTKVSFTHLIAYAIARAAGAMPIMAASFAHTADGKPVRVDNPVHLGLAVDSHRKDGSRFLVVPVIRDAATLTFAEFHAEYERLIDRARSNSLGADELRGASLTLTNPGGIGTVASVPRLMPGQGTILAAGAIGYPPEWRATADAMLREWQIAKVMTMTSTYDHRVIQGAESGEFLGAIDTMLGGGDNFYSDICASLNVALPAEESGAASTAPATARAATPSTAGVTAPAHELLAAMQAATSLIKAHRTHGHLGAHLDPLGTSPIGDPAMELSTYGLTPELMAQIPADVMRVYVPGTTLLDVLPNLRDTYCGPIAYEIEHISSHEQRVWLREHIESGRFRRELSAPEKVALLRSLTRAEVLERYLRKTFLGQKTFSGEGVDAMVPMLQCLLDKVGEDGIQEVVMGMSHRGRLNVIAHVVNQPYETILSAFAKSEERRAVGVTFDDPTGDVKYHLGATGTYVTDSGKRVRVRLLNNPSHLEAVDGVVEGWTRAEQTRRDGATVHLDLTAALPVLIHGDAAFIGQGTVSEVLNLSALRGYSTGGTVHIIANNQIGFTTDSHDDRSTRYASDLAKGFDIPIIHVNADEPLACVQAISLAYDYRRTYHRDVLIDLVGYRRFGHNETDEPAFTQPLMYRRIRSHPTVREIFAAKLVAESVLPQEEADALVAEAETALSEAQRRVKDTIVAVSDDGARDARTAIPDVDEAQIETAVPRDRLLALNEQLLTVPDGFGVNPKLLKQWERRREAMTKGAIDWGTAESLAFASLLTEGHAIRLTGQDTERGTFSQRHLALHDETTGDVTVPMQHLVGAAVTFELHNSPLSEVGALAFEFGYSAAASDVLVLWEAQFGDFVNNAQMVVDQFLAASMAKWGIRSRLTLLLPHGYEGMGPEHSSARAERFLQLAAHGNIRVANCSTSAQYFHLLRNQALSPTPRPLVLLTPKSLLRAPQAGSTLEEMARGRFQPVIDDPSVANRGDVTTLLLCTGKIYHELAAHPLRAAATDLAIARVEMLDPIPMTDIVNVIGRYPNVEQVVWVQEEPENMGAWLHLARPIGQRRPPQVSWDYVGRPRRASPSEGYAGSHHLEQERIVTEALSRSRAVQRRNAAPKADKATS